MTAFTIDSENNITIFASLKEIPGSEAGTETFTNQEEFAALADNFVSDQIRETMQRNPTIR
jgi:hypothetical protein